MVGAELQVIIVFECFPISFENSTQTPPGLIIPFLDNGACNALLRNGLNLAFSPFKRVPHVLGDIGLEVRTPSSKCSRARRVTVLLDTGCKKSAAGNACLIRCVFTRRRATVENFSHSISHCRGNLRDIRAATAH